MVARRLIVTVMRASFTFAATAPLALVLAACGDDAAETETTRVDIEEAGQSTGTPEDDIAQFINEEGVTPMEDRVATLGLLNKRNNDSQDIVLKPGESKEVGRVIVRLAACERTAPQEFPQETGAFVQVDILERAQSEHTRVFSGWLFKESPSRNVVEHPVYDVWVKDCRMRFPGEDALPEVEEEESDASEEDASDT